MLRTMIRAAALALALVPASWSSAPAQGSAGSQRPLADQFAFLVGEWEGPASIDMGPRGRQEATQREWVKQVAGGTVLTIEGRGSQRVEGGSEREVFSAFAVLYRGRDGGPALRAFRGDGVWVDAEIEIKDNGLVWSYTDPRLGKIRYTMRLDEAGRWHEIGERYQEGQGWKQFFEMRLSKVRNTSLR